MQLTPQQQATLTTGAGFWMTAAIPEASIEPIRFSDGPHGLRKQSGQGDNLGIGRSDPATCFPPAAGIASSWNPDLLQRVGEAIAAEARAAGIAVVLGPGVNIKRSPLCGRNFEYFSEDPLLSGELGAAWVRGLQSRGVGASLKHFVANNQETNRMTVSAEVDERTLRELYFPAFERIVAREQPWTVMCSYNGLNGVPVAESRWLLTDVLRAQWGFEGAVISDWGAVQHRGRSLTAGLDLEMPGPQASSVREALEADAAALAVSADRVAALAALAARAAPRTDGFDAGAHHALAREAATESIVLLRNEGGILPLKPGSSVAVIGRFAAKPRIQGVGSSQVHPIRVDSPLDAISAMADARYVSGTDVTEAISAAAEAETVLLFVGLPEADESEGYDRTHLDLPPAEVELILAVAAANPRTVVLLTNGGVVSLEPWHDAVLAILETWLLGQAGGAAIADVLFGATEPSGRLAESIPLRLQDTPSYLNFPGDADTVLYGERIFVGYRHYESADVAVRYPFGFGLTYTSFEYSNLRVRGTTVQLTLTNTGSRSGTEVAQCYVGAPGGLGLAPRRELRGFARVTLGPGQHRRVSITLDERAYSRWQPGRGWHEVAGDHDVWVGSSARDVHLHEVVHRRGAQPESLTMTSPLRDFLAHPVTGPMLARAARAAGGADPFAMVMDVPLARLARFPGAEGMVRLRRLLPLANNPVIRTVAGWFSRR